LYEFEWDIAKAESNIKKHGVSFLEATTVFDDPFAVYYEETYHSQFELRYIVRGHSQSNNLLIVNFTMREEIIRIISSRKATKKEKNYHEK
jgi:uncharacterized protein